MGRANPLFVVCNRKLVGCFEPRGIGLSFGLICVVNRKNHGRQERRLRARKIIGSIGIQNRAVVLDLKKEVFDHSFGNRFAVVLKQSENYEIAIPSLHLVELSARNYIGLRQKKNEFVGSFE